MGWRTVILVERHIDGQGLINANHFMFPHGFVRLDSSRLESVSDMKIAGRHVPNVLVE